MNNDIYGQIIGKNIRNKLDVRLRNFKRDYLKSTSKPSFVKQKIFDNNLAAINNIKTTLTLKLLAYLEMLVIELSKCQCINFIMMISKENMPKNRDYDSHILTV